MIKISCEIISIENQRRRELSKKQPKRLFKKPEDERPSGRIESIDPSSTKDIVANWSQPLIKDGRTRLASKKHSSSESPAANWGFPLGLSSFKYTGWSKLPLLKCSFEKHVFTPNNI